MALRLWRTGEDTVRAAELGSLAGAVADLARLQMTADEAAHAVGSSTVLVRVGEDAFGFIHQSVQEWLIARWIGQAFDAGDAGEAGDVDDRLAGGRLSALTVDFLCDLAGDSRVVGWARRAASDGRDTEAGAKTNAAMILQRRGVAAEAVNYAGTNLAGHDLANQNFAGADLSGTDLSGVVLPRKLAGANLSGASLIGARLGSADVTHADLRGADLSRAWLVGSNLTGARLGEARLDRAVLIGAALDPGALADAATASGIAASDSVVGLQLGTNSSVRALVPHFGGELLVSGHDDGTIRFWDSITGTPVRVLEGHPGGVGALAVDPGGRWLASVELGCVRLWDPGSGDLVRSLESYSWVGALAVDPGGRWLASAGDGGVVRLWDPDGGGLLRTLKGHIGRVRALAVDPGGRWLASAGDDGTVRLWDPTSGDLVATMLASAEGWATLLPDGRFKLHGQPTGLWWAAGLCRFDAADLPELARYQPHLRPLPDDAVILGGR